MDAIVSARIPVAVKERGNAVLKELGATSSQLINAAYEYVLAERKLPKTTNVLADKRKQNRKLSIEQREKIQSSLTAMYVGPAPADIPFKDRLNEARDERYARFT